MKLIEYKGKIYNPNQFVALEERERRKTDAEEWDNKSSDRELVITFAGGVTLCLPLSEREHFEQLLRG